MHGSMPKGKAKRWIIELKVLKLQGNKTSNCKLLQETVLFIPNSTDNLFP